MQVVVRDTILSSLCRMSSTIFPWCTEYDVADLPDYGGICDALKFAGDLARACVPPSFFASVLMVLFLFPGASWDCCCSAWASFMLRCAL